MTSAMERLTEVSRTPQKIVEGLENLRRLKEEDIQVGCTPKEEVFRRDHVTLYRYAPATKGPVTTPVIISYALVNRPYMVDLQEDRSLVKNLLSRGIELYLLDWGYPGPLERWSTVEDYLEDYMDAAVDFVRSRSGKPAINLLGVCQGGSLALCYTALHPEKVKNLITMVAPVDFHVEPSAQTGLLNAWIRGLDADLMVKALGNIPGEFMNFGYLMLRPFQLNLGKYLSLPDMISDEQKLINFLRMEKWIFDSPDQPGEFFRQFVRDFFQGNKMIKGTLEIGSRRVDLKQIKQPVLNVYAEQDHLVPPPSSKALGDYVGTSDYTCRGFKTGHIGMYVSGKVQKELPELIGQWLKERDA